MAEQNKTVVIAAIVILALVVIGVGSYFLFAGSPPPPAVNIPPPTAAAPAPTPEPDKKETRAPRKRGPEEAAQPKVDRGAGKSKTADEMTEEEKKERRGPTDKPRGALP
ncbi:MAG: hypothetical protein V2A79_00595 [Planctomycetota bacterium]